MSVRSARTGQRPLLLAHGALLAAVVGLVLTADLSAPWKAALLGVAAGPLLAAIPGLLAQRRYTLQWLAIALVIYIGVAVMEVIAIGARLHLASLALLAALGELALILRLVRRG